MGRAYLFYCYAMHHLALWVLIFCCLQGSSCESAKEEPGKYTLISAVKTGKLEKVKERLAQGADPNAPDVYGRRPLDWACFYDRKGDIIKALLEGGAKIDAKDMDDWIALDWAYHAPNLNLSAIRKVIQKAIALNMLKLRGYDGKTLLHFAAVLKDEKDSKDEKSDKIVEQLLRLGLDPNAKDRNGCTPLHYAVQNKDANKDANKDVVGILLHAGADIEKKDNERKTPLDCVDAARKDIIVLLLSSRATRFIGSK
ncbi:ankyrin repeat domain-containing protein [Cardinium endosymbiont of Nabis limbatus]|uniref:ankyrin repeat domain-containing protein n=1 Tax=Cardinium endosymbiont of Nabis limbatus TaxID=3066217 RepID=UPI003AF36C5A